MGRLREIPRTAAFAWSSSTTNPQIVTGTKAGAVDADFSNETTLEIWDLDFQTSTTTELKPTSSLTVDSRFHSIAWSQPTKGLSEGIIAGALENGILELWDAKKLQSSKPASLSKITSHSGAIKAVQFNPHRDDLLASSGSKGELYISNITNPSETSSFRLGTATARADDFDTLDWNKKVPHILVTGSSGGFATVWDVKAKKESINLNNYGRKAVSAIAWDPTTSTKLATATSSDQEPVILVWDLRNSNAPEKVLKGHDQGILSLAWSKADPRLLLSCGKDNRTIVWNSQTAEPYGEFPIVTNWTFQTNWNPKHPGLVATGSFDGKISIQSVQNTNPETSIVTSSQSLDDADFFASAQNHSQGASFSLPVAPTWLQRPVSTTFGFAGKLIRVSPVEKGSKQSKISISNFVSESSVGEAAKNFEQVLQKGDVKEFCDDKITASKSSNDKSDWTVIETLISGSRIKLKEYLGFSVEDSTPATNIVNTHDDLDKRIDDANDDDDSDFFNKHDNENNFLSELASSKGSKTNNPFNIYTGKESDSDTKITRALVLGKFEDALDILLEEKRLSDAFMVAICGGEKCIEKTKAAYFKQVSGGPNYLRLLASVSSKSLWDIVYNADLKEWKEVMAAICTYADDKDFPDLCEALGDRLEEVQDDRGDASFCYLAGSKLEKVVTIWLNELKKNEQSSIQDEVSSEEKSSYYAIHAAALQEFIEKVTIFRQVTNFQDSEYNQNQNWKLDSLYAKYAEYADILSSQGELETAERYLNLLPLQYPVAEVSRNRVKQASGKAINQKPTISQKSQRAVGNSFTPLQNFTPTVPAIPSAGVTMTDLGPKSYGSNVPPVPSQSTSNSYNPPNMNSSYTPMGYQPPTGGYQTSTTSYQPSGGYQPSSAFPSAQPFAPISGGYGPPTSSPSSTAPPPPGPSPAASKHNIPAWNDTPEMGPRMTPRRGTPSIVHAAVNSQYGAQGIAPPRTASPYGLPPKVGSTLPPPPKGSTSRTMSPATVSPATPTASLNQAIPPMASSNAYAPPSTASNSYAPPPSAFSNSQPSSNILRGASPYNPPPSSGIPNNRYAPAPGSIPNASSSSYQAGPPPPSQSGGYGAPPIASRPPAASSGPPPAPPPKGSAPPPRVQPGSAPPPSGQRANPIPLPSPQPSNSRPSSPADTASKNEPTYRDRSHIPPILMPIFEILSNDMGRVKSKAPQNYKPQVLDTEKRLDLLFDHLNNQTLPINAIDPVREIAQNIQSRQFDAATQGITTLMTTAGGNGSNWIVGLKRLILMSKATPL